MTAILSLVSCAIIDHADNEDVSHQRKYWAVGQYQFEPGSCFEVRRPLALQSDRHSDTTALLPFPGDLNQDALILRSGQYPDWPQNVQEYLGAQHLWEQRFRISGYVEVGTVIRIREIRRTYVYAKANSIHYWAEIMSGKHAGKTVLIADLEFSYNTDNPSLMEMSKQ
jgi:hypothetical protein